jgi:hypothetical protein
VYRGTDELTGQNLVLKAYHCEKMVAKHYHKLKREIDAMVALQGNPNAVQLLATFQVSQ